jgi:hypothetical protein
MQACSTRVVSILLLAASLLAGYRALAGGGAQPAAHEASAGHVMVTPDELKWGAGPPSLPAGARVAVVEGDPTKSGQFTIYARMPANYRIPAHWHPTDERVTVVSGTFYMGLGDKLDPAKGKLLPVGGYALMRAKTRHYAWTTREAIIQIQAMGPFEINYVNPADDPRNR